MTILLLLLLLFLVQATADEITNNFICVLTWRSWVEPDRIIITWEQLPVSANGSDVTVRWFTEFSTGVCSSVTLTSCMCLYGDANVMDFDTYFDLYVTIDNQTFILPIDPVKCQKPVRITEVSAEPINSTCLDVTWYYSKAVPELCSDYGKRVYQISYRSRKNLHLKEQTYTLEVALQSCSGQKQICGLDPFTLYEVIVRCKFTDEMGQAVGYWSNPTNTSASTPESVPTGAPKLVKGGFLYIRNNCHKNRRTIRIYFQPVPIQERNGIIIYYHVSVLEQQNNANKERRESNFSIPNNGLHMDLDLDCKPVYQISMAAATIVGLAEAVSTIVIPRAGDVKVKNIAVVPMATENDTLTVSWKLDPFTMTFISEILIIWCLKSKPRECQEAPSWQSVSVNNKNITIRPADNQPLHRYMVGISAGTQGIIWTTCQFNHNQVPLRPVGVEVNPRLSDRSVMITWENSPCESRPFGPYIDHFQIHICSVDRSGASNCSGSVALYVVSRFKDSYVIRDLDPDTTFMIWVVALGLTGSGSQPSTKMYVKPLKTSTRAKTVIAWVIPLACVVTLVAVFSGLALLYRKMNRRINQKSEIKVPEIPLLTLRPEMKEEETKGRQYASC